MRVEKLFLAVIVAPEIQRDKWQDKDNYARPRFSDSPIESRLQVPTVEIF
jgi:hypothetical protein